MGAGRALAPGGIIPAYAGSTWAACAVPSITADHPRIRGEHPWARDVPLPQVGSSPHTRGARGKIPRLSRISGIIPAYAGSTHPYAADDGLEWDHPRIRGEHGPGGGWHWY